MAQISKSFSVQLHDVLICWNKDLYEQKYTHILSVDSDGRNFILIVWVAAAPVTQCDAQ